MQKLQHHFSVGFIFGYCPEGSYFSGYCIICQPGFFCPLGSFFNNFCSVGYYCPAKSSSQIPCPTGTYGFKNSATSIEDCLLCPSGTFNNLLGQRFSSSCLNCPLGTFCPSGSTIPLPCPTNYYCPTPASQITCPAGTYTNNNYATDVSACIPCPKGTFCTGNGQNSIPCEAGTYSNEIGMKQCEICPGGSACAYGTSIPQICPKNTFASKGAAACTPCEDEHFTFTAGQTYCVICPSSRFNLNGWWCMSNYERIVFVLIWVASLLSGCVSIWKLYQFVKERLQILKNNEITFSIKKFIFLERVIKEQVRLINITENDTQPMIQNNMENITKKFAELESRLSILETK